MKIIKPQRLGVLSRTFENGDKAFFVVSVLVFFPFAPPSAPLTEVDLWKFAARELGDEPLDIGMPKQRGEVLAAGSAFPLGGPRPACAPRVVVGAVDKTLYVVGDRFWRQGVPSDPIPFLEMPVTWERAFGGRQYPLNPLGKGHGPVRVGQTEVRPLPNIEDPKRLVRKPSEELPPAGFGPYDFTWPQRAMKVGTYDAAWLKERFPGFAKDLDWGIWNTAPDDQQIAGYFRGDEAFTIDYMHAERSRLEGALPGLRTRAFVTQRTAGGSAFREISTRLDTVRLFPNAERGILVFRGMIEVAEDDAADILHLVVACETLGEPKPVEHYQDVLAQRLDKKHGPRAALRDGDLMPQREAHASGSLPEDAEAELLAREDLLAKNLRRRAEIAHEKVTRQLIARGVDPANIPPLPPEEPRPDLDDVAGLSERAESEAEKAKADAEKRRPEQEARLREACAKHGLDYEKLVDQERSESGGPPKFSAAVELARLREASERAHASGSAAPEIDVALADPKLEEQLLVAERQLREMYRKSAHLFPPAARLDSERAGRVRAYVIEARRAGMSFAGIDLTGADLSGLDLTKADFWGALLERVNFAGADLGGADLRGAVLARADLTGANLFAAKLAGANLGAAKLVDAELGGAIDMTGAVFAKADLTRARFHDACMDRADLSEVVVADTDFSRAKAREVKLIKADLSGAKLGGADLSKCTFVEATVAGVDFSGAKLVSAVFLNCNGDGAVFRDADLENVRFVQESSFEGADFRGARLDRANLRGTRLARSDFSKASLRGADLSECDLTEANFYRAAATAALFVRANLTKAKMTAINLMEGSLQKAVIVGADLRGANLFRVDFAKTRADSATNLTDANVKRVRIVPPRRGSNETR